MTPAPQHQPSIDYDAHTRRFTVTVDGKVVAHDAKSYEEAEELLDRYLRLQRMLANLTFPEGRVALTLSEAARTLKMDSTELMRFVDSGELRAFQLGERTIRITLNALMAWLEEQERKFADKRKPDPQMLSPRRYTRRAT